MNSDIHVTVWNEYRHEQVDEKVRAIYPHGIHHTIASQLREQGFSTGTATFDEPEHGLTTEILEHTSVLIWWAHLLHDEVDDRIVERVHQRVLQGMGLIVLHSGHGSKIFRQLMGTSCELKWREAGERERLWVVDPYHPITTGLKDYIEIPQAEMYGEPFRIPTPDKVLFISWFEGGEVFRSGCTFTRELGRIFYFRPGHETHPIYHQLEIMQVIANAVRWAAPTEGATISPEQNRKKPLETIRNQ